MISNDYNKHSINQHLLQKERTNNDLNHYDKIEYV